MMKFWKKSKRWSIYVRIKAAGGINSFEDAAHFMALGASRLGTSKLVSYYAKHYSDTL